MCSDSLPRHGTVRHHAVPHPAPPHLRHVYKLIRNALGDAYRMELVTRNVAMQVKAPPLSKERRLGLDMAEAKRLLDVIDDERLEALYALAMTTGLRCGELLALRWDDIDLGSRQLHVRLAGLDWLRLHDLRHGCAMFCEECSGSGHHGGARTRGDRRHDEPLRHFCRCFARRRPTPSTSCSEPDVSGFGYSAGYSKRPLRDQKWPLAWRARRDSNPQPSDP
jgi:hypothetical protein